MDLHKWDLNHFDSLLGAHHLGGLTLRYNKNWMTDIDKQFIDVHELAHKWVVQSTSFGMFQFIISLLLEKPNENERVNGFRKLLFELLKRSQEICLLSQEGYATYSAEENCYGIPENIQLPPEYQDALNYFHKIDNNIPTRLASIKSEIMGGIVKNIFNTSILINCTSINDINYFEKHLKISTNQPDNRLKAISDQLERSGFPQDIETKLYDRLTKISKTFEIPLINASIRDLLDYEIPDNTIALKYSEATFTEVTNTIGEALFSESLDYYPEKRISASIHDFFHMAENYAKESGFQFPKLINDSDVNDAEFRYSINFNEVFEESRYKELIIEYGNNFPSVVENLKKDFYTKFIELDLMQDMKADSEELSYRISFIPIIEEKNHKEAKNSKTIVSLAYFKITTFTSFENVKKLLEKINPKQRLIIFGRGIVNGDELAPRKEVKDILLSNEQRTIYIFPYSVSQAVIQCLTKMRSIEIKYIIPIDVGENEFTCVYVLKNRINVLLTIDKTTIDILSELDSLSEFYNDYQEWAVSLFPPSKLVNNKIAGEIDPSFIEDLSVIRAIQKNGGIYNPLHPIKSFILPKDLEAK